jgi:catechol 2,3-dioxygenase-like lactoylglutathione lyase family enzyme
MGATGSGQMNLLVNLDVDDLEKAVRFCSSVFGLRVGRRFGPTLTPPGYGEAIFIDGTARYAHAAGWSCI